MRQPNKITNLALHNLIDNEVEIDGQWHPARPLPYHYNPIMGIIKRIELAYLVFTGKADVLVWIKQ